MVEVCPLMPIQHTSCWFPHSTLLLLSKLLASAQIFLEMVLIGREDTLLQLAKTDKEKSGRQLLALLTLDDSFTSDKTRKALHKNAFALMKLRRYRDAAAAFLLADPPYVKEACSVLSKQHGQPMLALLVARLVEHKLAQRRVTASGSTDPTAVVAGTSGYALGTTSRLLLQSEILPGLVTASKSSTLRAAQIAVTAAAVDNARSAAATPFTLVDTATAPYAGYQGVAASILSLVSALWLQDKKLLGDTYSAVLGRYSLVDNCIKTATITSGTLLTAYDSYSTY
jgi:hypothetical protein